MSCQTVFVNGRVLTGDPARPRAHSVAVAEGLVTAFDADAVELIDGAVEVVDLAGGSLVPSFRDGHAHPLWGGVDLGLAPIAAAESVDDLLTRVGEYAAANPDREWITGGGFNHALQTDGIYEAELLDRVVRDRPVLLITNDYHAAWCNSLALERAGITASSADPARGQVVRRADGTPIGTLLESAVHLVGDLAPKATQQERLDGLLQSMRQLAEAGITWVQEAALEPADVATYRTAAERGLLPCDVNIALRSDPARWRAQLDEFRTAREAVADTPLVEVGTVKYFADGVIESGTGALLEPYTDAPHSCGLPNWDPGELSEAVAAFDAAGFQTHIHAIGDAGVRMALDAVEHAQRVNGVRDRRAVIAHTQLVHPDDVPRFAALGVIANFEPLWAQLDEVMLHLTLPRLGEHRSSLHYPMRTLQQSGARLSFGSDWPVTSLRPIEGLSTAVTRQTPAGEPAGGWIPDERLALETALSAYTAGVAFQGFTETRTGALTVGRDADLCQLSADITALPPAELPDVQVLGTWRRGGEVYRS